MRAKANRRSVHSHRSTASLRTCGSGILALLPLLAASAGSSVAARPDPVPMAVMTGMEAAFTNHRVVGLVDPRSPAVNRVVVSLMHDEAFRARTNLIVYDCCAPRYQRLVDRYLNGGDVSFASVSRAWAAAGPRLPQPNLFVEARKLNRQLASAARIRILLAHPWASGTLVCKRGRPCNPWGDRLDGTIVQVVERELYGRHRSGLLLAGSWKLDRRRRPSDPQGHGLDSAARRIERRHPGSLYLVWARKTCRVADSRADELVREWPRPAFAEIRGTSVGAAPETLLWTCVGAAGRGMLAAKPSRDRPVEDDVDAILAS